MNHYASKVVVGAQENLMKARDERVALMNEVSSTNMYDIFYHSECFLDPRWDPYDQGGQRAYLSSGVLIAICSLWAGNAASKNASWLFVLRNSNTRS